MFTATGNNLSNVGDYHLKLGFDLFDYRIDRRCIGFWRRRRVGCLLCENPIRIVLNTILCRLDHGSPRTSGLIDGWVNPGPKYHVVNKFLIGREFGMAIALG